MWGREKVAHRLRQLRASSEYSVLKTSSENGSDQVGHQLARQPPPFIIQRLCSHDRVLVGPEVSGQQKRREGLRTRPTAWRGPLVPAVWPVSS